MIDKRTQKQVSNRIEWALEEQKSAKEKVYDLFSDMAGLNVDTLKDNPQWQEITSHLANCQSHLSNALRRFEQEG